MPGIIIEKSFAQQQGKNYGTPAGRIMCTGAYMFKSWNPGVGVVAVANYADPAALLSTVVLPDGSQNYDSFNDPKITSALEQARGTADPAKRAALVAQAEKLTVQQMPWIPNAQPTSLLVLNKSLTGAVSSFAYMFAPWANQLGGTG
jgi:peptide/nickel transport system substrate-binding protein